MKNIQVQVSFTIYEKPEELKKGDQYLIEKAKEAMSKAYSPYSHFRAGCAVLLENSEILTGNNQENASSAACLSAEDVAVAAAGAVYPESKILKMAVYMSNPKKTSSNPIAPSGITRQRIYEYEMRNRQSIKLLLAGESGVVYEFDTIKDLLPLAFSYTDVV